MIHLKHKSSAISVSYPQINNSLTLKMLELYNDKDDEVMAVYYFLKVGTKKKPPEEWAVTYKIFWIQIIQGRNYQSLSQFQFSKYSQPFQSELLKS
jgi:hypothetical protein